MEIAIQLRSFPSICTVQQMAVELNQPTSLINGRKETMLNVCYPFPYMKNGKMHKGPVFIVKDERYEAFCERYLKHEM